MAADPVAPAESRESVSYSPIENEIPTYRAISPMAVTSFLLGLLSVVTFASKFFVLAGVAAIVAGARAQRTIRRYPDAYTGRIFAQAGIALGLVFCLSALTFGFVRDLKVRQSASAFARSYAEVLATKSLPDSFWYRVPPEQRKGKTPRKALDELQQAASANDPMIAESQLGPLRRVLAELEPPGGQVRFVAIESAGYNELTPYAFAIFEVIPGEAPHDHEGEGDAAEGEHDHEHEHEGEHAPQFAMIQIQSSPNSPTFDWYIQDVAYPYTRNSGALAPKPIDDGHGHSH